MSNPAVVKLCKRVIGASSVWMDDNFGESIHLHIDGIRADLSCAEFDGLCADLNIAIDRLINVEGFACGEIDPVYFESILSERILSLKEVKEDTVRLSQLLAPGIKGIAPLPESRCVRALRGDTRENDASSRISALSGQSNQERLDAMLESIRKNGYPCGGNYIILYGEDNIIRDGQHRAACLYHLYGDMEVPVKRLVFSDYVPENVAATHSAVYRLSGRIRAALQQVGPKGLPRLVYGKLRNIYKACKNKKIQRYVRRNGKKNKEIEMILLAK